MPQRAHLVCFRIGRETYGVDIVTVREIVKPQEITPVPGTTSCVLGIINLRGRIVSIVDLAARLGLPTREVQRSSRILVVDLDGFTVGFLVDAATEVLKLEDAAIEPAPEELTASHGGYLEGVGKLPGRLVVILNLQRLLTDQETEAMDVAAARASAAAKTP